ncbi:MAG: hypothetical protein EP297_06835 [Gammaproteobacteria bacterium]|nr:MAG: hypothetical protein EP297_06835 [Gammaproteobacteria bacterium]
MKVTPQIITFIVLVTVGWYTYENHQPFQALIDDIIGYAGLDEDTKRTKPPARYVKEDVQAPATEIDKVDEQLESPAQDIAVTESGEPSSMKQQAAPVFPEVQPETEPAEKTEPVQKQELVDTQPVAENVDVVGGVKFPPLPETQAPEVSLDDQPVVQPGQPQITDQPVELNIPTVEKDQIAAPTAISPEPAGDAVVEQAATAPVQQPAAVMPVEEQGAQPSTQLMQPADESQPAEKVLPTVKDQQQEDRSGYRTRSPEEIKALEDAGTVSETPVTTGSADAVIEQAASAPVPQPVPVTPAEEQGTESSAQRMPPLDETQPADTALPTVKDPQQEDRSGYRARSPEEIKALEDAGTVSEIPMTTGSSSRQPDHQSEATQNIADTTFSNVPQEQIADVSMYRTEQETPIDKMAGIPDPGAPDRELEELFNARDIWEQGDHDLAMKTYSELMMSYPGNPDFPGELGNIYFSKGLTDQAVDAYTEALNRLLEANDLRRAWSLYSAIKKIAPERAAQLEGQFLQIQN